MLIIVESEQFRSYTKGIIDREGRKLKLFSYSSIYIVEI
jgi:hypothetical protein